MTSNIRKIKDIKAEQFDEEYLEHYCRCQWLADDIKKKFQIELTPREIDKILLKIAADEKIGIE